MCVCVYILDDAEILKGKAAEGAHGVHGSSHHQSVYLCGDIEREGEKGRERRREGVHTCM